PAVSRWNSTLPNGRPGSIPASGVSGSRPHVELELDTPDGRPSSTSASGVSGSPPCRDGTRHSPATCALQRLAIYRQPLLPHEPLLPPGLIHQHRRAVGQIQTAIPRKHRNPQYLLPRQRIAHGGRQPPTFRTEQEHIPRLVTYLAVTLLPLGAQGEHAGRLHGGEAAVQTGVGLYPGVFVIIQPGTAQPLVIQLETQWLDQMQLAAGIGAQTDDVARVGRDLGLEQGDMEHGVRS